MRFFPVSIHLLVLLLGLLAVSGCSSIPADNRFAEGLNDTELSRTNGNCDEATFASGISSPIPAPNGLNPENITVVNWNLYKGMRRGWRQDLEVFAAGTDLLFLQEAALSSELLEFLDKNKLHWSFNSAFMLNGYESGVMTASPVKSLISCGVRANEPITGLPKTALLSAYTLTGADQILLVANVHGINFTLGSVAYRGQFEALADILEGYDGPMLVVGDFNNWNDKRSAIVSNLADKLSLNVLAFPDEKRTTFFGKPVDHIFYRGVIPLEQHALIVSSSDHNPMFVRFRLSAPTKDLGSYELLKN